MNHYSSTVLVTDIDPAPTCSFKRVLGQSIGLDASLKLLADEARGGGISWKRVAAGVNLFLATDGGHEIATMLITYIKSLISSHSNRNGRLLNKNALSTSFSLAKQKILELENS